MCGFQHSAACLHWTPVERGAKDISWVRLLTPGHAFPKKSRKAWLAWIDSLALFRKYAKTIEYHSGFGRTIQYFASATSLTTSLQFQLPRGYDWTEAFPSQSTKAKSCNSIFVFPWTWHWKEPGLAWSFWISRLGPNPFQWHRSIRRTHIRPSLLVGCELGLETIRRLWKRKVRIVARCSRLADQVQMEQLWFTRVFTSLTCWRSIDRTSSLKQEETSAFCRRSTLDTC